MNDIEERAIALPPEEERAIDITLVEIQLVINASIDFKVIADRLRNPQVEHRPPGAEVPLTVVGVKGDAGLGISGYPFAKIATRRLETVGAEDASKVTGLLIRVHEP